MGELGLESLSKFTKHHPINITKVTNTNTNIENMIPGSKISQKGHKWSGPGFFEIPQKNKHQDKYIQKYHK